MAQPSTVVIGFIGTQLDGGQGAGRWEKWRPTVSLAQHPDCEVGRFELFYSPRFETLARQVQADIAAASPRSKVNLIPLAIADPWDFGEVYTALYDWVRGYAFDTERERYWAHITTGTHVAQICTFLLVESRLLPGVLLQTAPPKRQVVGDPGQYTLIDLDLSRYDAIAQRFGDEQRDAVAFLKSGIATRNARFNALIAEIERVAVRSRAPILLTGPTGAGKSFLARRMFELKKARHQIAGPFVEVNCATLRGDSAASTLFGHKKGAFTGAATERAGLLRSAHHGVLFLDEIGELGLDEQAMLLKAIEEKRFFPMGADSEVESDFQLIAGTHRDLRREVAHGRFRDDLFARINLWTSSPTWSTCWPAAWPRPAVPCASTPRPRRATWPSRNPPRHRGWPTSATWGPPSPGWPRWPRAGASAWTWWRPRSPGCAGCGSARRRHATPQTPRPWTWPPCWARTPRRPWTCSTGCSSRPWSACAAAPRPCRTPAASSSACRAPSAAW
jgi:transcriptional regulatory protein RtcR